MRPKIKNVKNAEKKVILSVEDVDKVFVIADDELKNLKHIFMQPWKIFNQNKKIFEALNDITFEVHKGEFIGVVGRNGSGKSTLLKIIAGIYAPDKGKVEVNGTLVPFLELGVGFNAELSAKENVYLNGTILGMTKKFIKSKYSEIVEFAELKGFMDMPIKYFSSGMTVRLAFSIAIQAKADIYLLDEILSVGDFAFQQKSLGKIKELISSGSTVLFVSHSLDQVEKLCNRAIFIKDSRIEADGEPKEVVEKFKLTYMTPEQKKNYLELKQYVNDQNIKVNEEDLSDEKKFELRKKYERDGIGSGELKIEKVVAKYVDEEVLLRFEIKHLKKINMLNAFIGIDTIGGQHISAFGTNADNIKMPITTKKVSLKMSSVNLLSGTYCITITLFGDYEGSPYYKKREIVSFEVKADKKYKLYRGVNYYSNEWDFI